MRLLDFGVRCVVAPSFGDIFASNAVKNGLLPARVSEADAEALLASLAVAEGGAVRVDLVAQTISAGNWVAPFAHRPGLEDPAPQWLGRRRSDPGRATRHRPLSSPGCESSPLGRTGRVSRPASHRDRALAEVGAVEPDVDPRRRPTCFRPSRDWRRAATQRGVCRSGGAPMKRPLPPRFSPFACRLLTEPVRSTGLKCQARRPRYANRLECMDKTFGAPGEA